MSQKCQQKNSREVPKKILNIPKVKNGQKIMNVPKEQKNAEYPSSAKKIQIVPKMPKKKNSKIPEKCLKKY